jgi:acetyl esterase/lipase
MALENYRIDSEVKLALSEILKSYPGGFNAPERLDDRRALISGYLRQFPDREDVTRLDDFIESQYDQQRIPIRIYRPVSGVVSDGIVFAIHGGGMVMGSIADDDGNAARLSVELGVTVIAIDYRLSPEHPFPIPVEDCFSVAAWILDHGRELGVELDRSIIYGGSAGGGLAIATAMALRDRLSRNFSALVTPYPMLDYRNVLPSTHRILDLGAWDRKANLESWAWYLGDQISSKEVHPYASPLHAPDLSQLPKMFIDVGDMDLFLDEDIAMVTRLIEAGISVEFHCYPGAYHACELFAPDAQLSQTIWRNRFEFMKRELIGPLRSRALH